MRKETIRKEYFKLRLKGHTNNQCRKILAVKNNHEVTRRTLRRWTRRLNETEWNLKDKSRKPKTIHTKVTYKIEEKIIKIRNRTGWGAIKINQMVNDVSESTIKRALRRHKLCRPSNRRKKRNKYIRWQRKHPNSLWQIDHSDQKIEDKWCFSVIDDCSRFSLTLAPLNSVTTKVVTLILDELIKKHGKPREILSDNGSAYGLKSKHSKFDRWCRNRGIKHIRTAVHTPTTSGKVERLFQTMKQEMPYCDNDSELFRMRYNHFRPHTSLDNKSPADVYFDFTKLF